MIFARNVAQLQKAGNYTKTDLENLTGVSRRTIGRILDQARNKTPYTPTEETIQRFAQATGTTAQTFTKHRLTFQV